MSSEDLRQIDARIVQTIRKLKTSKKSLIQTSLEKQKQSGKKPFSSSTSIRKIGMGKINDNNHPPGTANNKISIEANDIKRKIDDIKIMSQKYFQKFKSVCIKLILKDNEISKIWKINLINFDIIYIENWLLKFLFQKVLFLYKLDDYEKGLINSNENDIKISESLEIDKELENILKEEILRVLQRMIIDIKIEKASSSLEEDFGQYSKLLNNFSYK